MFIIKENDYTTEIHKCDIECELCADIECPFNKLLETEEYGTLQTLSDTEVF